MNIERTQHDDHQLPNAGALDGAQLSVLQGNRPGAAGGNVLQHVRPDPPSPERIRNQVLELMFCREADLDVRLRAAEAEREAYRLMAKVALEQLAEVQKEVKRLKASAIAQREIEYAIDSVVEPE